MKTIKKGDVDIIDIRPIRPITEDFFLVYFHCNCFGAEKVVPMLSGDNTINIKFWPNREGNGKPTIVSTGLKWKTFNMDDNILVMIKNTGICCCPSISILITKKY